MSNETKYDIFWQTMKVFLSDKETSISKIIIKSNKKVISGEQQFCYKYFNLVKMQQIHEENCFASL